jgi:hypothetical protein
MWTRWWNLGMTLLCGICLLSAACSAPKQVLPQVGPRAVPEIFLPERPAFSPLTEDEFKAIPITAKGKILKNQTDWVAWADIADAAIQGYRSYIQGLFDKDAKPAALTEETSPKKGWKFWK